MNRAPTLQLALVLALAGCVRPPGTGDDGGTEAMDAGAGGAWLSGGSGTLASSTDGYHFSTRHPGIFLPIHALWCVGGLRLWAASDDGTLLATDNAGASWRPQATGSTASLLGVAFDGPSRGVAIGDAGTALFTVDGGAHWARSVGAPDAGVALRGVARAGSGAWVVVGDAGTVLRSRDDGASFEAVPSGTARALRGVAFAADGAHGFAVGDAGTVLATADGGAHWSDAPAASGTLRAVSVARDGRWVVAVGDAGRVWRSDDAGASFAAVASGAGATTLNALAFLDEAPDVGFVVGDHGTVLRTADAGRTFTALSSPTDVDLLGVAEM